jgi:hypothetical protein
MTWIRRLLAPHEWQKKAPDKFILAARLTRDKIEYFGKTGFSYFAQKK